MWTSSGMLLRWLARRTLTRAALRHPGGAASSRAQRGISSSGYSDLAALAQVLEVRRHLPLGDRLQAWGQRVVGGGDERRGLAHAVAPRREDARLALAAVRQHLVEHARARTQHGAVGGEEEARREVAGAGQRPQVVGHPSLGRVDDDGGERRDEVAAEQRAVLLDEEGEVAARVAGRVHDAQGAARAQLGALAV